MQILTHAQIIQIYTVAISEDLADSRTALLAGIPPGFRSTLKSAPRPNEQILTDLAYMNQIGRINDANGTIPLRTWLETAAGICPNVKIFQDMLSIITTWTNASQSNLPSAGPKLRDETGMLWAKRHLHDDLTLAMKSANPTLPLSIAFIDMNGLKLINDSYGHPTGDSVIIAFFGSLLATFQDRAELYRYGGDEVIVIMKATPAPVAASLTEAFLKDMGRVKIVLDNGSLLPSLTASCGIATTVDPNEDGKAVVERADVILYKAKEATRRDNQRVSVVAFGDQVILVI